jgi:hypothetical protein
MKMRAVQFHPPPSSQSVRLLKYFSIKCADRLLAKKNLQPGELCHPQSPLRTEDTFNLISRSGTSQSRNTAREHFGVSCCVVGGGGAYGR